VAVNCQRVKMAKGIRKVPITCPVCKITRPVNAWATTRPNYRGICRSCAHLSSSKLMGKRQIRRPKDSMQVLAPCGSWILPCETKMLRQGVWKGRCTDYFICPAASLCMDFTAHLNWWGFHRKEVCV
jgi:hypothetical protein